jgi:hypothetical protein
MLRTEREHKEDQLDDHIANSESKLTLQASGEELPADARYYPSESLRLADDLAPQLAVALSSCDAKAAEDVRCPANEFMYRRWNWDEHIEELKQYRVCFQMLSDIAATSRIVTDRNLAAGQHRFVAGNVRCELPGLFEAGNANGGS